MLRFYEVYNEAIFDLLDEKHKSRPVESELRFRCMKIRRGT